MANAVVVGMQWGDEGKGKIVDLLAPAFDAVVRFQGGHNAGHTVKFGDRHFSLHLIPSGILQPGLRCVLGSGMVVAPDALFTELERLTAAGIETAGRLFVSNRATVLLPLHAAADRAREAARGGDAIGTTSRGIGPAYESKASRYGLKVSDLEAADLEDRVALAAERLAADLEAFAAGAGDAATGSAEALDPGALDPGALAARCRRWGERLRPYAVDTVALLNGWLAAGESLLFEGAQGALLDVDHGTYPYVTSSNTTAGAAATGSGVPPTALDGVIGILKAYTTRVGAGPFVGELDDDAGEHLRRRGNEFGTTTGRPRRCGWLDLVAASYSQCINGVGTIALTKLDVLDQLAEIPVCVAYRVDGVEVTEFPADARVLARAEPVYETLPGWRSDTVGVLEFERLPEEAQAYVRFIERRLATPVSVLSTGPRREETIVRSAVPVLAHLTSDRLPEILAGRGAGSAR